MSDILTGAVAALNEKMGGQGFDGVAKFVIDGEGAVMIDSTGAHTGDEAADVTLTATADTFQAILAGDLNATSAFMAGKLTVDGDIGLAMKLGMVLS